MPRMGDLFHEAEEAAFGRHANPQEQPQEGHMSKLANAMAAVDQAKAQLAAIGPNALAEAIADTGAGKTFTPNDIGLVLAVIRAIEHGPGMQQAAAEQAAQQQTPAQQA